MIQELASLESENRHYSLKKLLGPALKYCMDSVTKPEVPGETDSLHRMIIW